MSYLESREGLDTADIKEQLNKFINLLQSDGNRRTLIEKSLPQKLSTIMSASEQQSSSIDKENSNPSANRSFEFNEKGERGELLLLKLLIASGLDSQQLKLVEQIKSTIEDLVKQLEGKQCKIQSLINELSQQKNATDDLVKVLMDMDKSQKELWGNYDLLLKKHQETVSMNMILEAEIDALREKVIAVEKDNEFMKKLIFHANENYEALEKKCMLLESKAMLNTDCKSAKKSSIDNLQKSSVTKKNSHSPSMSQVQCSPKRKEFQDVYRKLIVQTLKYKGKKGK